MHVVSNMPAIFSGNPVVPIHEFVKSFRTLEYIIVKALGDESDIKLEQVESFNRVKLDHDPFVVTYHIILLTRFVVMCTTIDKQQVIHSILCDEFAISPPH